jgi:dihydrofolate reductase
VPQVIARVRAWRPETSHGWLVPLKAFRESHGEEGGEVNASTPFAEDILGGAGATIMGRNMFGGSPGPWDESWKGWWGDNPPFHHPVFVLTSHPREPLEMQGGTTFHFVTHESSRRSNRRGQQPERRRCLSGAGHPSRSNTSQRVCSTRSSSRSSRSCSEAAPRLFENAGDVKLEQVESVEAPGVTHIRYARA